MPSSVTHKLIPTHLVAGERTSGSEISLNIDQTLAQDATSTMVMLELETMAIDRGISALTAPHVDHCLSPRQVAMMLRGDTINRHLRRREHAS